ncbi:MFS transporter [Wenxinia saemankumensis]|uniref:Predicted arabinose efflux permease, MFS family n=1 Tax=Wenxinia saemankumensis TaxID=1447782 RepID=A0A1M6CPR6_9RHOB|nr:MFS transporter [Wenxinia saemankumensis]SHI62950.1 Predicted arabinose efflux permease, MFS family [Wenxinia saemankumensis]
MRTALSFAALFLSVALLQLSSGGVGPLDALTGLAGGFTAGEVGLLGSAHFLGFFAGCWAAPRMMGALGHARTFAALTALGAIGLIGHTLVFDPLAWAALRLATGLCIAGCYTVVEAWLSARATNETRGRTFASYRIADMGASLVAQLMIGALAPLELYVAYNTLALFACAALLPLTLSRLPQPATPAAPRLRPRLAWDRSPLAVAGCLVSAVTGASFRMVGPIYGEGVGLEPGQIGVLLAAWIGGGALAQLPVGWAADKIDRRWVLIWLSAFGILASAVTVAASGAGTAAILAASALFGMTTFPIYSVAASHAHDHAAEDERVELSAALMFWYAVGAIAAPWVAALLIGAYGPAALFVFISAAHVLLIAFGLARMRRRASPETRTRYVWVPRTSFTIGRLTGRARTRQPPASTPSSSP